MENQLALTGLDQHEIAVMFPLIEQLFKQGEKLFGRTDNGSEGDYFRHEGNPKPRQKADDSFAPLCLDQDPSRYYLAYYSDRRSDYFKGDRGRFVCLSTQTSHYATNEKIREVIYREQDGIFTVTIKENVLNKAMLDEDSQNDHILRHPKGHMKATYRLTAVGKPTLTEFTADRFDEVSFPNNGVTQPCRWNRELYMDTKTQRTTYRDGFIFGRSSLPQKEIRGSIRFEVEGLLENPKHITMSIGDGAPSTAHILFKDEQHTIILQLFPGYEHEIDVLKQDPNLAFLFTGKPQAQAITDLVRERIALLMQHWDTPQSVFITPDELPSPAPALKG